MTIAVGVFRVLEQLKTDIFIEKESVLKSYFLARNILGHKTFHHKHPGSLERGLTVLLWVYWAMGVPRELR